jgi:prepilin-type N-terminal cleavage/methylation domain-containing protein
VNKHHFTLIEMVVAMAVMVVVAMIIGTASATFYNAYQRSTRNVSQLETCLAIDRVFDSLVRNAIPFKWLDDENSSRFVFEGNNDSLLFTALRRIYGKDSSAILFVRLLVEDEQLIAEYSNSPILPWSEEEETQGIEREVLAKNIAAITFEYAEFDEESGIEWLETWEEDDHTTLPLAIRMTVEWTDGRKEYWLRRLAGTAKESTFGYRELPTEDNLSGQHNNSGGRRQ